MAATKTTSRTPKASASPASLAEIVCIVDRSGSMSGLTDDTIGGFNAFLAAQKAIPGEARFSLVLFDHEHLLAADRVPLAEARPLSRETYVPRGQTALFDAVGRALTAVAAKIGAGPAASHPERVVVAVLTDGYENASRTWSGPRVRALVEARQAAGWEFVFLGAGLDVARQAGAMGIVDRDTFLYEPSPVGTGVAFSRLASEVALRRRPRSER